MKVLMYYFVAVQKVLLPFLHKSTFSRTPLSKKIRTFDHFVIIISCGNEGLMIFEQSGILTSFRKPDVELGCFTWMWNVGLHGCFYNLGYFKIDFRLVERRKINYRYSMEKKWKNFASRFSMQRCDAILCEWNSFREILNSPRRRQKSMIGPPQMSLYSYIEKFCE